MPKRSCTDRAKWVLLRGKPAQPLSAHYQLDCDYGTPVLTIYREGEGDTPTYLCEVHAAAERDAAVVARPVPRLAGEHSSIGNVDCDAVLRSDRPELLSDPPAAQALEDPAQHLQDRPTQSADAAVAKRSPRARKPNAPSQKSSAPPVTPVARVATPSPVAPKPDVPIANPNASAPIETAVLTRVVPEPIPPVRVPPAKVNLSPRGPVRDLTYGNPAKALVDETIWNLQPGDYDAYRTALREGKSVTEAAQAAGGQLAVVHRKIHEYSARIDALLSASNATIEVEDAIHRVLETETLKIIAGNVMSDDQKDVALARLGEFQEWINHSFQKPITPLNLHQVALAVAERAKWGGACDSISNELKSVYGAVYSSLRDAIHSAVPDVRDPGERLANLHAAKCDWETIHSASVSAPDLAASSPAVTSAPEEKFAEA